MKYLVPFLLISLFLNIFFICNKDERKQDASIAEKDTIIDSLVIHDTLYIPKPYPVKVTIKDTIYLPLDSVEQNGDSLLLPREEKVYEDSTFKAVVSGFRPSLDEITVYPRTVYITKEITKYKNPPRFQWGLQGGFGYGLINRKPDFYVGFGGTIRLGK